MSASSKVPKELGLGKLMQLGFVTKNTYEALEYYEKTLGLDTLSLRFLDQIDHGRVKWMISLVQFSGVQFELIELMEETRCSQLSSSNVERACTIQTSMSKILMRRSRNSERRE